MRPPPRRRRPVAVAQASHSISKDGAEGRDVRRLHMVEGVKKIGVVGAGTMGAGVAEAFAAAGFPVVLRDIAQGPLDRGMGTIKKSLERLAARGKLAPADAYAALVRVAPTVKMDDLADCDVVVEAVFERFDLKKTVMGELDNICQADAILATNNSRGSPRLYANSVRTSASPSILSIFARRRRRDVAI